MVRLRLNPEAVVAVTATNRRLEHATFLMYRIRYFQGGAVLGGAPNFVLQWLQIKPIG